MSDIAIRVENLGKQYHIGALQKNGGRYTYKSLRDSIASAASAPFRAARALMGRNGAPENHQEDTIWALRDVSFDLKHGEIVGVIGRNGAGKSTLLKILSRITEPTTGHVQIRGRIGSLLEVGTGFHPELSGRDNVYLNGAILGMKHTEIARNFDAIVAFAEVEKFIDTPVKHYSSGMYLRLAFAVAAHLQTEILLVDEVLSVGDSAFQKKCLGKMGAVATQGRTVVFVSHDLGAVQALCRRAILLMNGQNVMDGIPEEVTKEYLTAQHSPQSASEGIAQLPECTSGSPLRFLVVRTLDERGAIVKYVPVGGDLTIEADILIVRNLESVHFAFVIRDDQRRKMATMSSYDSYENAGSIAAGYFTIRLFIQRINLLPGRFSIDLVAEQYGEQLAWHECTIYFDIVPSHFYASGKLPSRSTGIMCLPCSWDVVDLHHR
jgi:lipopolysaccharide transport system ATP-binding protein